MLLCLLALAGCVPPRAKEAEGTKVEKKKDIPAQRINLPNGESLQYRLKTKVGAPPEREPAWYVKWVNAKVQMTSNGPVGGRMEGVSGNFFKDGKKSTTFQAQSGLADKANNILNLAGQVQVVAPNPKPGATKPRAVLTCDRLVYDATTKRFKALGHVQVVGEVGTIGTLSELWATEELDQVATPDMFIAK
ncbi:LPS export ABC transporter periplasmic protein LptC [Fimbriimonas ginsengisoli]|uniref:Uncharacterized protein n=1 Tax=Fimbriimonas ginsengisoli Gsoil 348 TaxID=661478 RepID=A0A068NPX8_FIMGI|nr:LPS export ABC transporter periplasmic protein LptC [Fimbriimonas ginsengisoli]AIE85588.1 hypothetical protein OP10G_2220 [Fimbriimonas ginsengisoli Gsoil 348]